MSAQKLKFFLLSLSIILWASPSLALPPQVVYLYTGEGAHKDSIDGIENVLNNAKPKPLICRVDSFKILIEFLKAGWPSLWVMPGGASSFFERDFSALSKDDQQFLSDRVRNGTTSYLGICAGAYFAAESYAVNFCCKDGKKYEYNSSNCSRRRRLAIFPPMSSALSCFVADSPEGICFPEVALSSGEKGPILWNGGPKIDVVDGYEVLGRYTSSPDNTIVAKFFGENGGQQSCAIVTGVHFELKDAQSEMAQATAKLILRKLGFE